MAEYIEREALYKIMENWRDAHADVDDADGCGLLEDVMCEVNAQTAADVAPVVHGRWIPMEMEAALGKGYECSICKKSRYGSFKPNYCPNCGARMDGE